MGGKAEQAYITIVRRRHNILELLASENINANEVTLGMTVLACLGSGDLNDLEQHTG